MNPLHPSLSRADLYRHVRMVLVRHFVDIGQLSIQVSATQIRLVGSLNRLPGVENEMTADTILTIFSELRRLPGVTRVQAEFDNWTESAGLGAWRPIEKSGSRPPVSPGTVG